MLTIYSNKIIFFFNWHNLIDHFLIIVLLSCIRKIFLNLNINPVLGLQRCLLFIQFSIPPIVHLKSYSHVSIIWQLPKWIWWNMCMVLASKCEAREVTISCSSFGQFPIVIFAWTRVHIHTCLCTLQIVMTKTMFP